MDFLLKFSSELVVVILCLLVAGINIFYFSFAGAAFKDQSLANNFISLHPNYNLKLYDKNSSIVTLISRQDGIFPQAQADDFTGLGSQDLTGNQAADNGGNMVLSDNNSILAPNPDSIQSAVTNVVKKIYITQPGDTLKAIAAANGISVDSIKWSNGLTGDSIAPGWNLIIPPVDGVAIIADSNTTLPDLAVKYNPQRYNPDKTARDAAAAQLLDVIISYNGLDSAEDINAGDFIVIPGGVVAAPPAPKIVPKPKSKTAPVPDNSMNDVTSIGSGYDGVNHFFPKGYCTYYVASQMKITFGGNAKNWLANAAASGYVTGKEPAPHSAVVFTGSQRTIKKYGHVAYVESVNDDGTITISEMNYDHFNRIDQRILSVNDPSIRGYIYP
jgi:surface antigen/LysM repeat protein